VLFWPGFIILHLTKAESFSWPPPEVLLSLLVNCLLGTVLSDLLWGLVVFLTSPLVATMGLSLTIPLAMIVDYLFKHTIFSIMYIFGSIVVVLGFVLVNLTSKEQEERLWEKLKSRFNLFTVTVESNTLLVNTDVTE